MLFTRAPGKGSVSFGAKCSSGHFCLNCLLQNVQAFLACGQESDEILCQTKQYATYLRKMIAKVWYSLSEATLLQALRPYTKQPTTLGAKCSYGQFGRVCPTLRAHDFLGWGQKVHEFLLQTKHYATCLRKVHAFLAWGREFHEFLLQTNSTQLAFRR